MSVNYLKFLLDKFMVLIISMSLGIIRLYQPIDSKHDNGTCQYVGCHKKTYTVLYKSNQIKSNLLALNILQCFSPQYIYTDK